MSLYGTRDAAANFQEEVRILMKNARFRIGRYNPCTFCHPKTNLKVICHGGDFVSSADEASLVWLKTEMKKRFESKIHM